MAEAKKKTQEVEKFKEGYSGFSLLVVFIAAMGPFLFGYNTAVVSGALLFLGDSFTMTVFDKGMVVSIILLGAMLGAAIAGTLTDRLGRKWGLIINGAIYIIGGYITYTASTFEVLLWGRLVMGLGVGITSQAVPLYLSEIAPVKNRGAFVSIFQLSITLGILVAYGVGYALSEMRDWRGMFGLSIIPGAILFLGMFLMVESPSWLIARGHHDRALRVLKRLRDKVRWDEHIADVKDEMKSEKFQWTALWSPNVRKVVLLGVLLSAFQQVTGINTVIYYAPEILNIAGFTSGTSALLATVGIGLVNVIVTVFAVWILDRVGRKPLLLVGIGGMVACLAILGVSFLFETVWMDRIAMVALMGYVAFFAIGLGPVTWVVISEIFPVRVRALAIGVAAFVNWTCNYIVSLTFLDLLYFMGTSLTFFTYGVIGVFAFLFALLFIPETKGKTADQIQNLLKKASS